MEFGALQFSLDGTTPFSAVALAHDPWLVSDPWLAAASLLVAAVAAYGALASGARRRAGRLPAARVAWLIAGTITTAVGIWAMHYVALQGGAAASMRYDAVGTLLALLPAALGSAAFLLAVAADEPRWPQVVSGGVAAAAGATATLLVALASTRGVAVTVDGWWLGGAFVGAAVLGSIAVAVGGGHTKAAGGERRTTAIGTALLALALAATHHATAAGVTLGPAVGGDMAATLDSVALTSLVGVTGVLVLFLTILAATVDGHLQAAYAAARASRILLQNTSDSLPDALVIVDAAGQIVLANAEARAMFPALRDGAAVRYDDVFPQALEGDGTPAPAGYGSFAELSARVGDAAQVEHVLRDGHTLLVRDQRVQSGGFILAFADVTDELRTQRGGCPAPC